MFSLLAMVVGSWWRNDGGGREKGKLIEDDFVCVVQFATQLNAGHIVNAGDPCAARCLQVNESAIFLKG
jgi:adenylosuccinate synthase